MTPKQATVMYVFVTLWAILIVASMAYLIAPGDKYPEVTTVTGMCPTEDSCTATYTNGQWTIKRVTP